MDWVAIGTIAAIVAALGTAVSAWITYREYQGNKNTGQPASRSSSELEPKQVVNEEIEEFTNKLQTFKFDVVTVDSRGQIVKREKNQARYFTEELDNGVTLDMVYISGGKFLMGSPEDEGDNSEKSQHEVTISSFFMGKYPITQAQYQQVMSDNPSKFKGDDRPVECVSWDEAVEFCRRLSKQTGKEYRLPSEAEWEYACRARTNTPFYFGDAITYELANYDRNISETTSVGHFPPNAFGLYDMHGNVAEWCQDNWHINYENAPTDGSAWLSGASRNKVVAWLSGLGYIKVIRGGSWFNFPRFCRSASRSFSPSGFRFDGFGFRVVCVVPRTT